MLTSLSIGTGGLGRFGNQMLTISSVIGIAKRSGQPYGFPKWVNHDNALFGDNPDEMDQYFVNPLPRVPDGLTFADYGYFWEFREITLPTGNWSIDAHMQDPRYFNHCMETIREQFRMKDEPEQNEYVAIHYRAGDYQEGAESYHPRQSKEYYERAMGEFPAGTAFLVFSDDMKAALKVFGTMRINIDHHDEASYIEDFKLMKRCRSFIIANSSFSLMAAILGEHHEKKIVAPSLWFGKAANGLKFEGYPEGSIII